MQNMASGRTAKDSILMLQANHVDVIEVQEPSGLLIRRGIVLCQRPSHRRRIVVALFGIVYRQCQQASGSIFRRYGVAKIGGERGNSTLPRKVVSDHGD